MTLFDDPHELAPTSSLAMSPFDYEGHPVRTNIDVDGGVLFSRADVCAVLGIVNAKQAADRLDPDERGVFTAYSPNGVAVELAAVTEAGLYALVLTSRRPEAKTFKRWVTHDVLPAIRRTGSYVPAPRREPTRLELIDIARDAEVGRLAAEAKVAELEPAADAWAKLADAQGDMLVADAAKILDRDPTIDTGQKRLFNTLLNDLRWCYRGSDGAPRAMQDAVNLGRLTEKPQYRWNSDGERVLAAPQVRVTVKGLHDLHKRLKGSQPLAIEPARTAAVTS